MRQSKPAAPSFTESRQSAAASEPVPQKRWNRYFGLPLMLGALAFLLLVVVARASVASVVCGVVLLATAVWVGRLLARAHAAAVDAATQAAAAPVGNMRDLCAQTLPVWQRQVDTSRGTADAAVAEITRTFAGITEKLEKVLESSHLMDAGMTDGRDGVLGTIARSGADLDGLVDALRQLQDSKDSMVRDIGVQAASLRENAAEVRGIAMQTRILTLNAAIEAARAGEAGAPFAVIVGDMRQLAARTAETSEQISKQTEVLNAAVETAFRESKDKDGADGTSIARAQEVIRGVVASFQSMTDCLAEAIESMEQERGDVRGEISNALMALQFQDRVSQILSHVSHGMGLLTARLSAGTLRESDVKDWLAEMSAAYTTNEEFGNLQAAPGGEISTGKAITYF